MAANLICGVLLAKRAALQKASAANKIWVLKVNNGKRDAKSRRCRKYRRFGFAWVCDFATASARCGSLLLRSVNKGETDEKTRFHQIFGIGGYGCAG